MKNSYIKINDEKIPTPDELEFEFKDIEGASSGLTEAGVLHRDIVREGVVVISLKLTVSMKYLVKLSKLMRGNILKVKYLNPYTLEEKEIDAYCTNYKVTFIKDSSNYSLWNVDFKLEEY